MYVNDMDPYEEAQHILEVLERGNPLKGVNSNGGVIQIEQQERAGLDIVLEELKYRGYKIISIQQMCSSWAVGIEKEKTPQVKQTKIERDEEEEER